LVWGSHDEVLIVEVEDLLVLLPRIVLPLLLPVFLAVLVVLVRVVGRLVVATALRTSAEVVKSILGGFD
jgi:hypothetical protein